MNYAVKSLKMRADGGDAEAMVELGRKFAEGVADALEKYF